MPDVNPIILVWVRETAGLSLEEAAKAVGIGDARGNSGEESLAEIKEDAHYATDARRQPTLRMTDVECIATHEPSSIIRPQLKTLITAEIR